MAYNKTSEERKWNYWKEQEEKKLRELGMEEEKIQKLRQMDREDFLEERRFREHLDEMMQDMDSIKQRDRGRFAQDIRELLDNIGDRRIYELLKGIEHQTFHTTTSKQVQRFRPWRSMPSPYIPTTFMCSCSPCRPCGSLTRRMIPAKCLMRGIGLLWRFNPPYSLHLVILNRNRKCAWHLCRRLLLTLRRFRNRVSAHFQPYL